MFLGAIAFGNKDLIFSLRVGGGVLVRMSEMAKTEQGGKESHLCFSRSEGMKNLLFYGEAKGEGVILGGGKG